MLNFSYGSVSPDKPVNADKIKARHLYQLNVTLTCKIKMVGACLMKKLPKDFLAYGGKAFIIEWYYDSRDCSQAKDYYEKLSKVQQNKLMQLFRLLGDSGKIFNKEKFRSESDQIYAFKLQPDRFLCFFYIGSKIIVTNAFEKKQDKLPAGEKAKALKSRSDYVKRVLGKDYYD